MYTYYRQPQIDIYDRNKSVQYAHQWAFKRNPRYLDFENFGGDCTNFASQVIFAGCGVMNFTPAYGWFYINSNKRTASWTGVNFLYNFLVNNKGPGPYASQVDVGDVRPGDIIQLSFQGGSQYDHSPVVVETGAVPQMDNILIAAHTYDRDKYKLTEYKWKEIRFLHIEGVRR